MSRQLRALPFAAVLLLPILLAGAAQAADSFGVSHAGPGKVVEFGNVLPSEPVTRKLTVQNTGNGTHDVTWRATGDLAEWLTLDVPNPFQIGPRSQRQVNVTLTAPSDAALATYKANLTFERISQPPEPGGGARVAFNLAAIVQLTARVTNTQSPYVELLGVRVPDVLEGAPLQVHVRAKNAGNVRATFNVDVRVTDAHTRAEIAKFTQRSPMLTPGTEDEVAFARNLSLRPGQYLVKVEARPEGDGTNASFNDLVEVVDPAKALAKGELRALAARDPATRKDVNWFTVSDIVLLTGTFVNRGDVPVFAILKVEVLRDGKLVDAFQSDQRLADPGETIELDTFLKTTKAPGSYEIRAHATYAGKITPTLKTLVNVNPEAGTSSSPTPSQRPGASATVVPMGPLLGFLALAGAATLAARKRAP